MYLLSSIPYCLCSKHKLVQQMCVCTCKYVHIHVCLNITIIYTSQNLYGGIIHVHQCQQLLENNCSNIKVYIKHTHSCTYRRVHTCIYIDTLTLNACLKNRVTAPHKMSFTFHEYVIHAHPHSHTTQPYIMDTIHITPHVYTLHRQFGTPYSPTQETVEIAICGQGTVDRGQPEVRGRGRVII